MKYFYVLLGVFAVSSIGSIFTTSGMSWYKTINLPSFTPEGSVIGLVWTVLFLLIAVSISLLITVRKPKEIEFKLWASVALNAFLNIGWSFLFFYQNLITLAFVEALLLLFSILLMIYYFWKYSKLASLLLVPYALWVGFATYLTYSIMIIN